jgi:hypothetical protein
MAKKRGNPVKPKTSWVFPVTEDPLYPFSQEPDTTSTVPVVAPKKRRTMSMGQLKRLYNAPPDDEGA